MSFFSSTKKITATLSVAVWMLLGLAAGADAATYVITANGSGKFTAKVGDTDVKSNDSLDNVIAAIKNDANGAECTIKFAGADPLGALPLDIGAEYIEFKGPGWGVITLEGKVTSSVVGSYFDGASNSSRIFYGVITLMNEVSIESKADIIATESDGCAIYNASSGTVTISAGTISVMRGVAVRNGSTGSVNITGGTISTGASYAVYNQSTGTVNVGDGTITATGTGTAIYNNSSGTVNITGGTISSANREAIYNNSAGSVNISGGTVSTANWVTVGNNSSGKIIVSGGAEVRSGHKSFGAINNDSTGTVLIVGGSVSAPKFNTDDRGIIVEWVNPPGPETYTAYTETDIFHLPVSAKAVWGINDDQAGIDYANGAVKGFVVIEGVTVTPVSRTQIPKPKVTNTNLVYTGSVLSAGIAPNAAYTVIDDSTTNAGDYNAKVILNNRADYEWSDSTDDDLILPWSIGKAPGTFVSYPVEINTTYSPTLKLSDLTLLPTYVWVTPNKSLSVADSGKSFEATYNDPSGNYNPVNGDIKVHIAKAAGTFGTVDTINTTYTPTLTLSTLTLPANYAWKSPTTQLNAGNGQPFEAVYTDPSGNYTAINGDVTVNVAKAPGTFGTPGAVSETYSSGLTLGGVSLTTLPGYAWTDPTTPLNAGNGQSFPATYTNPNGNYTPATGTITVNVAKAAATGLTATAPTISISSDSTGNQTFLLSSINLTPNDHGTLSYTLGTFTNTGSILAAEPTLNGLTLSYKGAGKTTGAATQVINITSQNYNNITVTITFTAVSGSTYLVTVNGGTGGGSFTVGTVVPISANAPALGKTFDKWTTTTTGITITNVNAATTTFTMPAKAVAVTATYKDSAYTITYILDGGTVPATANRINYTIETATFTLTNPTKNGYTFAGWTGSNGATPQTAVSVAKGSTGNKTYTANWTPITYTITYNLAGGTAATTPVNPTSYTVETDTIRLANPTRTSYVFTGWTGSNSNTTPQTSVFIAKGSTGNKTYTANWTTYTVTFNVNGGVALNPNTAKVRAADGKLDSLPTPTRSGYAFNGWYTEATGGDAVTPSKVYSANTTIYAQWLPIYTITFNANGGTVNPMTAKTGVDGKLDTLPTPTRSNYAFNGWFTAATGGEAVLMSTVFTENKTIFAQWSPVYTVTFNLNYTGGGANTTAKTGANSKLVSLPKPTRSGYAFVGWFTTTASTGGEEVTLSKVYTANTTIYARWVVAYTIKFNAGTGGSVTPDSAVTNANGRLATLPTPTRSGYAFIGWFTAATSGTEVTANTAFTANTTIYAQWTRAYTVTFNAGTGGTVTPATGTTGAGGKLASLPTPTRSGYAFAGWFTTAATGGTEVTTNTVFTANTIIYAQWTVVTYTITFNATGGAVTPASAATGAGGMLASLPTPATRTGYSFSGWYTAETGGTQVTVSTVFSANATIYALWAPISYTITYTLNGGTATPANPTSYTIETPDITLNNPIRASYIFDGWTGANGTAKQKSVVIPQGSAGNKSYTANWTVAVFTIFFDANGGAKLTPDSAKTAAGGKLASLPTPSAREGYAFDGWFTAAAGGAKVTTSTVFEGDATVYAQWSSVYTVTFDANGGAVTPATANTGAGGKLASLPTATLKDYTLIGWYTAKEGGARVTTSTVFDGDAVVYARWSPFTHATVTFGAGINGTLRVTVDGVPIASGDSVGVGSDVVFTAIPDDGYGIARWTVNGTAIVDTFFTYVIAGLSNATSVVVSFVLEPISVASPGREIPRGAAVVEAAVAPVKALSGGVTVGPNPVRAGGEAAIYRNGGKAVGGKLSVFDALGQKVAQVNVNGVKKIGAWKVGDAAEGTYLIKGVLTDKDGAKVKVSVLVGVVR